MAKIGNLVSKLQINGKTFQQPEWWSTQHKLTKHVKEMEIFKVKIDTNTSFTVNSGNNLASDKFIRELQTKLDSKQYSELAPWNSIFNKAKPIILFKK